MYEGLLTVEWSCQKLRRVSAVIVSIEMNFGQMKSKAKLKYKDRTECDNFHSSSQYIVRKSQGVLTNKAPPFIVPQPQQKLTPYYFQTYKFLL